MKEKVKELESGSKIKQIKHSENKEKPKGFTHWKWIDFVNFGMQFYDNTPDLEYAQCSICLQEDDYLFGKHITIGGETNKQWLIPICQSCNIQSKLEWKTIKADTVATIANKKELKEFLEFSF